MVYYGIYSHFLRIGIYGIILGITGSHHLLTGKPLTNPPHLTLIWVPSSSSFFVLLCFLLYASGRHLFRRNYQLLPTGLSSGAHGVFQRGRRHWDIRGVTCQHGWLFFSLFICDCWLALDSSDDDDMISPPLSAFQSGDNSFCFFFPAWT